MRIKIGKQEVELRLTSQVVESIEETYDLAFSEIFAEGNVLKTKDYCYMLHCMSGLDIPLDEFKKELSKNYTYVETMHMFNEMFKDPNAVAAEPPVIEKPLS